MRPLEKPNREPTLGKGEPRQRWMAMSPNLSWLNILGSVLLVAVLAACSAPTQPSATVEALQDQVAALSSQLEQLQASPTPASAPSLPSTGPESTDGPATLATEAAGEPGDEVVAPASEPRAFPTRAPRPITASDAAPCALGQVKGNRNSRIYHVPGGGSYAQTRANVECFDSEEQAQAAGYRRARN